MATAHIDAKPEDFASTVLMLGDPLRAKLAPLCSYELLSKCIESAKEMGAAYHGRAILLSEWLTELTISRNIGRNPTVIDFIPLFWVWKRSKSPIV